MKLEAAKRGTKKLSVAHYGVCLGKTMFFLESTEISYNKYFYIIINCLIWEYPYSYCLIEDQDYTADVSVTCLEGKNITKNIFKLGFSLSIK